MMVNIEDFDMVIRHRYSNISFNVEFQNKELKKRTRCIRVFPNRESLLKIASALLIELDESWLAEDKVYLVRKRQCFGEFTEKRYVANPYDGHTLKSALAQTTKILGFEPGMAIYDLGYRGNNYDGGCNIQVVNRFRKRISRSLCRWWNRRSAIEPVIGHCKSEHRMDRNQLRGQLGDELNVIFAAA